MRFTLKNPRFLQYIDYQDVRKTEFLGCQSQVNLRSGKGSDELHLAVSIRGSTCVDKV